VRREMATVVTRDVLRGRKDGCIGSAAYGHNGYFRSLKEIVHFYDTRDVLPRCAPGDPRERTGCWPAPETTENFNKSKIGNLGSLRCRGGRHREFHADAERRIWRDAVAA
jgi:hypothetical protein